MSINSAFEKAKANICRMYSEFSCSETILSYIENLDENIQYLRNEADYLEQIVQEGVIVEAESEAEAEEQIMVELGSRAVCLL